MISRSRPLRFLCIVVCGWVGVRAAMLWPVPEMVPAVVPVLTAPVMAAVSRSERGVTVSSLSAAVPSIAAEQDVEVQRRVSTPKSVLGMPAANPPRVALGLAGTLRFGRPVEPYPVAGADAPPTFRRGSRWSASVWAIGRPNGAATPFASQLGGSQLGARLAYAIDRSRRIAGYARVSTAIDTPQREAAVGLDWRPTRLPIHLFAEQRIGIERIRGGPALGMVGGIGPTPIAPRLKIEAYAQAGVIFRDGREGFVDGAVRLTTPVARRIDLGLGAWGAAQRGAERLDVGPTIGVTLPVEGRALRLALDWRQRAHGDARPGSGPAISLGADF